MTLHWPTGAGKGARDLKARCSGLPLVRYCRPEATVTGQVCRTTLRAGTSSGAHGDERLSRLIAMLSMLIRENLIPGELARRPEANLIMNAEGQAAAWHEQGADDGPIAPVYHLNALACSRLVPLGGTVVDLGCGSGQFAAYLARCRPDLRIVGFDLSAPMIDVGNTALHAEGLGGRVELRQGDMTAFAREIPPETALINCLFAIHHLPGLREVERCLTEIRTAVEEIGCSFLIFDLVRPRHASTTRDYPRAFTPDAPEVFQLDSTHSLIAAYSHRELKHAVDHLFRDGTVKMTRSRVLPLYQAFWHVGALRGDGPPVPLSADRWDALNARARGQYRALRAILPEMTR